MKKEVQIYNLNKPLCNSVKSKSSIFKCKLNPNNLSSIKDDEASELFDAFEPSADDEDVKNWEINNWRIDYYSFLNEIKEEVDKTELNISFNK